MLVMRPEFHTVNTGSLFVFLCASIVAVQMVINRKLGARSHPLVISLWGASIAALSLTPLLPFYWHPIDPALIWILGLMIVSGAANQILIVFAFARTEASILAPFTYFEIVAAVLIGYLLFGTLPDWLSWSGIALIIASGLVVTRSMPGRINLRRNPKF